MLVLYLQRDVHAEDRHFMLRLQSDLAQPIQSYLYTPPPPFPPSAACVN